MWTERSLEQDNAIQLSGGKNLKIIILFLEQGNGHNSVHYMILKNLKSQKRKIKMTLKKKFCNSINDN